MCQLCSTIHIVLVSTGLSELIVMEGVCFITNCSFKYHIWVRSRMFYYTVLFYYRLQFQVQNKRLN